LADADDLYRLPPEEFTKARNDLAKRLRKEGDRESAEQVGSLRRPTVAAWAVNQLSHERPKDVKRLLDASERLAKAQASGRGMSEAAGAHREATQSLVASARDVLERGGGAADDATLQKVWGTLQAAGVDEEVREAVRRGRLEREQQAATFGPLTAGSRPTPARRRTSAAARGRAKPDDGAAARERARERERAEKQRRMREEARRRLAAAREAESEARRRVQAAQKALREAETGARKAAKDTERAKRRYDQAG
jgi:hypothetical protein